HDDAMDPFYSNYRIGQLILKRSALGRAPAFSPFCRRVCVNAVKSAIPVGFPLALYYPLPINRLNSSTS
ncbi:hypothetical protein ACV1WV_13665, partial [Serratia marcescens]